MGEAGRQRVLAHFSMTGMVTKTADVYRRAVEQAVR
jgi:hypothetical protein